MQSSFQILGLNVPAGSAQRAFFELWTASDSRPVATPVTVINGKHPGPTLFIGAGVHGEEINGVRTAIESIGDLDPENVSGRIVAMPVQNPIAYQDRRRLLRFGRNEQDRKPNLHQAFPGSYEGETTERAAKRISALVLDEIKADFAIDLHTGTSALFCAPHSFVAPPSIQASKLALDAADALDLGLVVQASSGVYAAYDMPHVVWGKEGLPVLGLELGAGGRYEPEMVKLGVEALKRVFAHLGIVSSTVTKRPQVVLPEVAWIRAPTGGLLRPKVALGDKVVKGQPVATIQDPFGHLSAKILADNDGFIISQFSLPTVHEGEPIARIGIPA